MIFHRKIDTNYFWVGETNFIHNVIGVLQREADASDYDFRLVYRQSFSIPKKFYGLYFDFGDGIVRKTAEELDSVGDSLLANFEDSKGFKKAKNAIIWWTPCSRNGVNLIEVSYVLYDRGKSDLPGVMVYWARR